MDCWPAVAELPLTIGALDYGQLDPGPGFGEAHSTRLVRLAGDGYEGLGEDITLFMDQPPPELALGGRWTLGDFCEYLAGVEQWPSPPEWEMARGLAQLGLRVGRAGPRARPGGTRAARRHRA